MNDLESLKQIFKDNRDHLLTGMITKLSVAEDRSVLKCLVKLFPDGREIVARMTWEMVGNESGIFSFPSVNDMVLVGFAGGEADEAYVLKRLTSKEDKIPVNAVDGHLVIKSLNGKQVWITSDNKILMSVSDDMPTENLVLGQQLKAFLIELLTLINQLSTKISTHTHAGNLGYPTSPPNEAPDFIQFATEADNLKESPVEDEAILSDIAFTEKG